MTSQPLRCSVITPEARMFEGPADFIVIPAHDGEIGILDRRAPLVCKLGSGRLCVRAGGQEQNWFVDGGFAQVLDNQVMILTQKAVRSADIDRAAAQALLDEARQMAVTDDESLRRREQAETRARAQIRIAGR